MRGLLIYSELYTFTVKNPATNVDEVSESY